MHSYNSHLNRAYRSNLAKRITQREITNDFNKMDAALATKRLYCIMSINKSTNNLRQLSNDHYKCPYLYEADAIDFNKQLRRTHEPVKRCVICTRALHPMLDVERAMCSFCSAATTK
ncbi:asb049 [Agrotis segetum nucleopolyhedrovirus B]|uniref:Asb049 n=1 Tax=Agrotis segetum nucleopolyhedrovirus B TaxID=1580580 RepID=A0A0A7KRD4_9ABAC|nr:asb049 [Agrotis segetum nucleopolyhedrovirus B]AIZ48607.1 asb049 [Agrotis segetum nucleopolyhedrovirus B]